MRASPMYNIAITEPSIAPPTKASFRWAWDSSHYVPFNVAMPFAATQVDSTRIQSKVSKVNNFIE